VAHEIRNPLAGIGAGVEYLGTRLDPAAPEQEDLRFVLAETQRLNRIVSELLDYAHPRPLHREPLEVGDLVPRVEHALEPHLASRSVRLECRGPLPLAILGDPDRVQQILLNLVKNAVEAAPGGSTVRLEWSAKGGEEAAEGNQVRFLIIDRGPGMTAEQQAQAFEPFYTTKATGTGLGLHMAQAIAEQHGGSLRLLSVPGEGTTAVLELPAARAEWEEEDAIVHSHRR
jgi:signal transduction histidine kinase